MKELTKKQKNVLDFIRVRQQLRGHTPSLREIAEHIGATLTAAADHVRALKRKGVVASEHGMARSLHIVSPLEKFRTLTVDVPVFGDIPAGWTQEKQQEAAGCISIDVATLGIKPSARIFALEVRGDSMIGKHILPGDYVIFEHGRTPKSGDVVAALIDNENTLKTYLLERGKPCLKAENPRFPKMHPADELVIQGVMVGLVRRGRK